MDVNNATPLSSVVAVYNGSLAEFLSEPPNNPNTTPFTGLPDSSSNFLTRNFIAILEATSLDFLSTVLPLSFLTYKIPLLLTATLPLQLPASGTFCLSVSLS